MIVMQGVFHSNPFSGFRYTPSRKSPLLGVILLRPELRPFIIIIPMSFSICDTFDKTHVLVRGDRDSRATLMPIYGDLYQIKL